MEGGIKILGRYSGQIMRSMSHLVSKTRLINLKLAECRAREGPEHPPESLLDDAICTEMEAR